MTNDEFLEFLVSELWDEYGDARLCELVGHFGASIILSNALHPVKRPTHVGNYEVH